MGGKTILDLNTATFPALAEDQFMALHQTGDTDAERTPLSWYVPVAYDNTVAYVAGRQVFFEKQVFLVITATSAAQTPLTHRAKFQYLSGGINLLNAANNGGAGFNVNITANSGIAVYTSANIGTEAFQDVTITNPCILVGTDVEVYVTDVTGSGIKSVEIVNKIITNGQILVSLFNPNNEDVITGFQLWFNNRA